jgi:vacuolar-type H+-ATPase subunit I/STV1
MSLIRNHIEKDNSRVEIRTGLFNQKYIGSESKVMEFTIITPPEYEALVLEAIGRVGVAQLKEVSGEFEQPKDDDKVSLIYKTLYEKFHGTYKKLVEITLFEPEWEDLSKEELREFTYDPEGTVDSFLYSINDCIERLDRSRELGGRREAMRARGLLVSKVEMERAHSSEYDEGKRCLGVGVVDIQYRSRITEYLKRFEDVSYKLAEASPKIGYIFVAGPDERREWVETIFSLFEVKNLFEVLTTRDDLLVLDAELHQETFKECKEEIEKLRLQVERGEEVNVLTGQIEKILKDQCTPTFGKARFLDHMLWILSNEAAPVLRMKVISVIQGWIPEKKIQVLDEAMHDLEKRTGELFLVKYKDPSPEEGAPTPRITLKPRFLDPAFTLMSLRGWPSTHEVNPAIITIIVFSLQFGIMFGDVGQGLIFLLLGLLLSRRYKSGMTSKLATMFVPMGVFAIIFGFLYGEVFLMEGIIHPILFSPIHDVGKLFKFVLGIAVLEMCIGLVIGAINAVKEGHILGPVGQHGAGSILFLVGLYFGALYLIEVGDFRATMSHWSFMMMVAGLLLSGIEPLVTSFMHGNPGAEVLGEVIAAFMMVFVEILANFFSFLRIGAFTLAHACLAVAAHALTEALGPIGIVLMNVIAMTFEFISCSVQSLRLLYYEFMSKFFKGTGDQLRPFRLMEES